ncbi:MAG: hypothetical protein KAJ15_11415, partial [Spirochaetes bacterium]|nr:hypothetical protein [Spirochaetota bacterium]
MSLKYTGQIQQFLKSLYTGIGKSFIIFPSVFLVAAGITIIELGIIFYLKEIFGASPSHIGYFAALWSFWYIIGCIFIRPLFNKVLPRYLLIGSSFFMSFSVLSILFTKAFAFTFLYYNLYGIAMSFFWP